MDSLSVLKTGNLQMRAIGGVLPWFMTLGIFFLNHFLSLPSTQWL